MTNINYSVLIVVSNTLIKPTKINVLKGLSEVLICAKSEETKRPYKNTAAQFWKKPIYFIFLVWLFDCWALLISLTTKQGKLSEIVRRKMKTEP